MSFERTARMILAVLPPLVTYAPVELTVNVTAKSCVSKARTRLDTPPPFAFCTFCAEVRLVL